MKRPINLLQQTRGSFGCIVGAWTNERQRRSEGEHGDGITSVQHRRDEGAVEEAGTPGPAARSSLMHVSTSGQSPAPHEGDLSCVPAWRALTGDQGRQRVGIAASLPQWYPATEEAPQSAAVPEMGFSFWAP